MVVGNGLLANRFSSYQNDDRFLIFAAGVSNSKNRSLELFDREFNTLATYINSNQDKTIVYFSTYSIYDPGEKESAYVKHKLSIEKLVRETAKKFVILRVSNVAGKSRNPNTVLNYLYYHIRNRINFDLWVNACRNIIDIDDVFFITAEILNQDQFLNCSVNVGSPINYQVKQIVEMVERFTAIKSNYTEVDKGSCFEWDLTDINPIIEKSANNFDEDYLKNILKKYYA